MICDELSLIAHYFDRVRGPRLDTGLGIGGGCALLNIPGKQTLAIGTNTLVAGNHFLPNIDPADLAYRALAANLSDLTAMGANPTWLALALTPPDVDEAWLESFSDSLFDLLNYCDMRLTGDDTTRKPLLMTLGIRGFIPMGQALARSGVKLGDRIYVTGTPGDSTAGLAILQNHLQVADAKGTSYLIKRYLYPSPCILQGQALRDLTNSAIDLSGGLIFDFGYVVKVSDCDAHIGLALSPFSDALSRHVGPGQVLRWALSGGEDYELCFTALELDRGVLNMALGHLDASFTCIGQMTADTEGLCFIRDDEPITLGQKGYDHFAMPQRYREKSPEDE